MTDAEKDLVRRLVVAYGVKPTSADGVAAWHRDVQAVERELPWADDPGRATFLMEFAWRAARVRH